MSRPNTARKLTCSGGGSPVYLEIYKLPDGSYRATVGTLFEHQEICSRDLEALVRQANVMAGLSLVRRRGARHSGAADALTRLRCG